MNSDRQKMAAVLGHTLAAASATTRDGQRAPRPAVQTPAPARSVENLSTSLALRGIRAGVTEAVAQDDLGTEASAVVVRDAVAGGLDNLLSLTLATMHVAGAMVAELCTQLGIDAEQYVDDLLQGELARQAKA